MAKGNAKLSTTWEMTSVRVGSSPSAMTTSETYKGEITAVDATKLISRTFYVGEKGDEIANYSYNYTIKPTGNSVLKSTSFFYYDAGIGKPAEELPLAFP